MELGLDRRPPGLPEINADSSPPEIIDYCARHNKILSVKEGLFPKILICDKPDEDGMELLSRNFDEIHEPEELQSDSLDEGNELLQILSSLLQKRPNIEVK